MENKISVQKAVDGRSLEKVFEIRRMVFVDEQHCPPGLEWEHEDESTHFIATFDGTPAGACRWRKTANGYKLERFVVLKEFRGKRIGQALVAAALNDLPAEADYVYLNAQLDARGLYEKFGFKQVGEEFEEAGIRHYKMERV